MAKHRRSRAPPSSKPKRKKKPAAAPSIASYHRGMSERDYTALIPPSELQQLQLIVSEVHAARGWGATRMECTAAWDSLLEQAMSPEGGSWDPHLPAASSLQAERLAQLAGLVDRVLLGGALQGWLRAQGKAEVRFQPVSRTAGPDDWLANFFPEHNTVALKRGKWADEALVVTRRWPANYEGVQCVCRLQVLLHTLAHEMVHALVYHRLPHVDAGSPAYRVDECHGPSFRLLNARLFGHTTEDFRRSRPPN